jgi:hypothetical protein
MFKRDIGRKDLWHPGLEIMIVEEDFHGVGNWVAVKA